MSPMEEEKLQPESNGVSSELLTVAFLGPKGTYSHQAAFNRFGDGVKYVQKDTIADTFNAIPSEAQIALIPAENSIFGSVVETLDLLRLSEVGKEKLVRGEDTLQVQHCLVVSREAHLDDIAYILSHEQALGQCSNFLKKRFPNAALVKTASTAAAAEAILTGEARKNSAAICSEVCTTVYPDLVLVEKGIQNEDNNYTTFWVITDSSTHCMPSVAPDEHRALLRVSSISDQDINLSDLITQLNLRIQSIDRRPSIRGKPFHDTYFLSVSQQSVPDLVSQRGRSSWVEEVSSALERVRTKGWEGISLGIW